MGNLRVGLTARNYKKIVSKSFKNIKDMNLLEKIDELRAQSVTNEMFEAKWGYSVEAYLDRMMKFVEEQKNAEDAAAK